MIHQPFRAGLLANAIRLSLLGLMGASPLMVTSMAQAQADIRRYEIEAGSLSEVLSRFAGAAGAAISFDSRLIEGRRSAGLHGQYSVEQGFATILAATGFQAVPAGNGSYVLQAVAQPGDALELGATSISGQGMRGRGVTEGSGSYTTGSTSTATRLDLSLRETPQSISVVTRQRMDDQNMQRLEDIALYTPGLMLRKTGGERPEFYSRGSAINRIMIDGLPVAYDSDTLGTATLAMFDHVEVVRGASGLMTGAGNPSGTLNLVRKRPTLDPRLVFTGSVGRWDDYRMEVDAAGKLNDAGSLRGRFVSSYQERDSFIDAYGNERQLIYAIGEYDLNDSTTLTLGGYYNREDNPGADWNGLPAMLNGAFFPFSRSTRTAPEWTYWDKKNKTVFVELEHAFANGWSARLNTTWLRANLEMLGGSIYVDGNDDYHLNVGRYSYEHTQKSVDAYASGPFTLFGRSHELVVGGSYRNDRTDDGPGGPAINADFIIDPLTFDPKSVGKPAVDYNWTRGGEEKQSSLYTTARFNLSDDLHLILGSRLDWYEYNQTTHSGAYSFSGDSRAVREHTPYAGIVKDLDETYSLYASWTRIFRPQTSRDRTGSLLEPVTGTNQEIGVKGAYFGGALNASMALFQLVQENLPKYLPACSPGVSECYEASGEVRTRGVDLELSGALTPAWQVSAGYTYAAAEYTKGSSETNKGERFDSDTPYNLLKLSTTYRLPGELERWSVGGSLRTQSSAYTSMGVSQGGYSVVDMSLAYRLSSEWNIQANLNNALDRRYYQNISNSWGANSFGDPRNLMLTVRYSPAL